MIKSFGFSGDSQFFYKKADFIKKYFYNACMVIGALFIALGGDFAYDLDKTLTLLKEAKNIDGWILPILFNNWFLFLVGGIFLIIGSLGNHNDNQTLLSENNKLSLENQKLESLEEELNFSKEENETYLAQLQDKHQELIQSWLKTLYNHLKLTSKDRITIYFVQKKEFTLLGRYSSNPKIKEVHNQKFPINQGVISLCWQHGTYKENDCPSFYEKEEEYYEYMLDEYNYGRDKMSTLTMKSNKYFGVSIRDVDDTLGVILFESCDKTQKKFDTICATINSYCSKYESYLSKFVKDAIELDRLSNVKISDNIDDEALEILGGDDE